MPVLALLASSAKNTFLFPRWYVKGRYSRGYRGTSRVDGPNLANNKNRSVAMLYLYALTAAFLHQ